MMPFTLYGFRASLQDVLTSYEMTNCKIGNTVKIGAIN
jgi:hypothetical protein